MLRVPAIIMAILYMSITTVFAQQTPPVMPKIQETPLPPPVSLPAPPCAQPDVPNRPLSADEAAQIALYHQPEVTVAKANINAAQGQVTQARSGLLPSVGTTATYTNIALLPVGTTTTSTFNGYQVTATLQQLIFDFNHTRDLVRQAKAERLSAAANLTRVQSDLVLQVKQNFYNYAQMERLVSVNEANVRNQQDHLALAQAKLKSGLGLPADVVRAETAVAGAIYDLNVAQNNASIARVGLAQSMGIDPRTPIEVSDTGEPPIATDNVQALTDQALRQRPEILQAQANVNAARLGVSAAKTSNAPTISANTGWLQRGANFPPDRDTLTYGVAMEFYPFDSGLTRGRVQTAQANLQAITAQQESTRLSVISDVSQAYLNLKTAEQRVVTANAEVANAEESLRLIEGRYKAGLGTFLDVLDAQNSVVNAKTNLVNAQSAVNQARAAMVRAVGATNCAVVAGK